MKKFDYIIVCTYGRSGSTLLQGLLNSLDNIVISGENNNFPYHLYLSYNKIKKTQRHFKNPELDSPTNPWYRSSYIDLDSVKKDMHAIIRNVLSSGLSAKEVETSTIGFKEIRFIRIHDMEQYLEFLLDVLPNCGIIFNHRDTANTLKSGWWKSHDNKDEIRKLINTFKKKSKVFHKNNLNNTFLINYEDIVARNENLRNLLNYVGSEYDEAKIEKTLGVSHSYNNTQEVKETYSIDYLQNKLIDLHVEAINIDKVKFKPDSTLVGGTLVYKSDKFESESVIEIRNQDSQYSAFIVESPIIHKSYSTLKHTKKCRFRFECDANSKDVLTLRIVNNKKTIDLAKISIER